jgi:iron complex outermembrane receptor protein
VAGGVMERTPAFTGNVSADWTHPLMGGTFEVSGNYSYQTKASFDFADTIQQKAYGLLTLRVAWTDPSRHWQVSATGRNLTDTKYLTQVLPDSGGFGAVWGEPPNFLVKIAYSY